LGKAVLNQSTYTTNMENNFIDNVIDTHSSSIWVFGYGSLTWKPDFTFKSKEIGYIKGYQRRFWQGNITHRGTINKVQTKFILSNTVKFMHTCIRIYYAYYIRPVYLFIYFCISNSHLLYINISVSIYFNHLYFYFSAWSCCYFSKV